MKEFDQSKLGIATFDPPPNNTTRVAKDFGLDRAKARLPIASDTTVNHELLTLFKQHRNEFAWVAMLQVLTVIAALVAPRAFGNLLEALKDGAGREAVVSTVLLITAALTFQTIFAYFTRTKAAILGEFVLSALRERFVQRAVQLPPDAIERAGSGELLNRTTTDINHVTWAVRDALPVITICISEIVIISIGIFITSPVFLAAALVTLPVVVGLTRWYLRRSPQAYRVESSLYSQVNSVLVETAEGGRTIEALQLGDDRLIRTRSAIGRWLQWERYTMRLRSRWFPAVSFSYIAPLAAVLPIGASMYQNGQISLAQLTAALLYTQMLADPIEGLLWWIDEFQSGKASLSRLLGIYEVPNREIKEANPANDELIGTDVHYAYRTGKDVLKGVNFIVQPGTRLAIVGPSGAGKSTLGRLLAGVQPPTDGKLTVGDAEIGYLPVEQARSHVALVTQEHHVFVGTIRENVSLAFTDKSDDEIWQALDAVNASMWVRELEKGLDTEVGSGGHRLLPAQAQQIALARLVLANPRTLVLDEATSLLDAKAARNLEGSLNQVLGERTVIAIAHRLQTAHDADLIAVVEDGEISEWGSHDQLLAAGGAYAALWRSWRDEH
ncbi:MAG: ABC transporter ATP-binding protein [Actinobacteria bacterium]|nr:ABC transporter ATP-binding protein [Actinomycetota bacterium]